MSFYTYRTTYDANCPAPGPAQNLPDGLCERARVQVKRVYDSRMQQVQLDDVTFDLDKFMSFEGKTGVYLLYTLTRIRAVLEKAGVDPDAEAVIHSIIPQEQNP